METQNAPDKVAQAVLWGGTGQARVVRPILEVNGFRVIRVFDNNPNLVPPFSDVPFGGDWKQFVKWRACNPKKLFFVVCIGGEHGRVRAELSEQLTSAGLNAATVVHDRAWVAATARLGAGAQILAMAAVCEGVSAGDFCIVNTAASVDHGCKLGRGVHVMPGARIAGEVVVDDFASIGTNATILPGLKIGSGARVGAGAVVIEDIPAGETVIGIPARPIERLSRSKQ